MCGICGFFGKGSIQDIESMNQVMFHRGPDDGAVWHDADAGVYLGHRRLSIIDLSSGASQPMWTVDRSLGIVFNGEIYNHIELRAELAKLGHKFVSDHSDTEVLLHGYTQWGEELPNHLNAMWAFAIYDRNRKRVFFSRDRFGKKPLFYTLQNGTFAFASELSSVIKHSGIRHDTCSLALKKYYAYGFIPAPYSIYKDIYKLPGGHNLVLDLRTMKFDISKYWDYVIEPFEKIPDDPEEEWGGQIRDLLFKAVKRRLQSDVPLGVFLSGGVDSSSIAALAVSAASGARIKTFSIGFEEASFDETAYSKAVSGILGTEHYAETLSVERSKELLPDIISKLDEPMGDSSILPTYLLCKEVRKQVTVAVGGDGSDELFAGYDPFKALKLAQLYEKMVPKPVHMGLRMLFSLLRTSHGYMTFDFRIKRTLRGMSYKQKYWNPVWLGPLGPDEINELFGDNTSMEELYSEALQVWDDCKQENLVDKTLQFFTKLYLQDDILVKVDRASMMNSLEVRAPYLDIDFINLVRRIPHEYKFRNGETKYILKEALRPILPLQILFRSKQGFGVPIGKWFKEGGIDFEVPRTSGLMNGNWIEDRYREHKTCRHDHRAFLWNTWLYNLWSARSGE